MIWSTCKYHHIHFTHKLYRKEATCLKAALLQSPQLWFLHPVYVCLWILSWDSLFPSCLAFIPVSQRVRMNMWMKSSEIRQAQHFSESSKSLKHQTGEKVLFCPFSYPSFKHCSIQLHFQMCLCRHSTSVARKFKEGSWITSQPSHFVLVPKFSLAL